VHRDRWISVRADDCVTATGTEIAPYYVLEYPDWVQVIAITEDDQVVLIKQYRHGIEQLSLELPSGGVESGETNPLVTAARELVEETGYVSDKFEYLARLTVNPANHTNSIHVILARDARAEVVPVQDPTEEIEIELAPLQQAMARLLAQPGASASHVASLSVAMQRLSMPVI
jgi:8-oxo-dGTP pyrophosphatase MutT (NUDIX family)